MIRKVNCKLQTKVTRTKGFLAKFEFFYQESMCLCACELADFGAGAGV